MNVGLALTRRKEKRNYPFISKEAHQKPKVARSTPENSRQISSHGQLIPRIGNFLEPIKSIKQEMAGGAGCQRTG